MKDYVEKSSKDNSKIDTTSWDVYAKGEASVDFIVNVEAGVSVAHGEKDVITNNEQFTRMNKQVNENNRIAFRYVNSFLSMNRFVVYVFSATINVEVATFTYETADSKLITLDNAFSAAIGKLPIDFNDTAYSNLFKAYGTMYVHSGTLGGYYEYENYFDRSMLKKFDGNTEKLKSCVEHDRYTSASAHFKASASTFGKVGLEAGGSHSSNSNACKGSTFESDRTDISTSLNQNRHTRAYGGSNEAAALATTEDAANWIKSVRESPIIISKTLK